MDLDQLANLGEFVGGVAVVVTLLYLAAQVRSGAREQRASSMREATRELAAYFQSIGESDEKAGLWLKGIQDFEGLNGPERLRFSVANGHYFRLLEQIFEQERAARIDPHISDGFMMQLRDIAAYPGIQSWWATRRHWYSQHFRAFVESNMGGDNRPSMYGEG